jgi:hypothetical protein
MFQLVSCFLMRVFLATLMSDQINDETLCGSRPRKINSRFNHLQVAMFYML